MNQVSVSRKNTPTRDPIALMSVVPSNSLRRQLVVRLSVPLLGLMVVGAVLSFMAARHFASAVHDEGLYDAAMSLAPLPSTTSPGRS